MQPHSGFPGLYNFHAESDRAVAGRPFSAHTSPAVFSRLVDYDGHTAVFSRLSGIWCQSVD